jgi:hypothetical protein
MQSEDINRGRGLCEDFDVRPGNLPGTCLASLLAAGGASQLSTAAREAESFVALQMFQYQWMFNGPHAQPRRRNV